LFTITPRLQGNGNTRMEIIYVSETSASNVYLATAPLSQFLGEWVEVTEQIFYGTGTSGRFSIVIKRVSDGATLINYNNNALQTFRAGNTFVRPKWGIYRSLNNSQQLRDDSLRLATISVFEGTAPSAPSNLQATAVSASQINVTWQDNSSNETGFVIERSLNGTSNWAPLFTTAPNVTSYANTGLSAGTTYYYRVSAQNPAGSSNTTSVTNATTQTSARRKIILKLDDLEVRNNNSSSSLTLDYIVQKKIKASLGAIAQRFDASALGFLYPYLNSKDNNNENLFEVWHHGFDHISPEFRNTGYAYQKWHFDSANNIILNLLRLQMRSFGAPFNHNDTVTNRVISENPNYRVCMFNNPAPAAPILNLTNRVNMENGTGNPDYNFFLTNYNNFSATYTDYMVLQGHPNIWGASQLAQFSQIIDFLIAQNCEFVQPYEYYLSLNPGFPRPTQSQTITFSALPAKNLGDPDFSLNATASSGLGVLYNSSNPNVATIVNGTVRIVGAGTTIITAAQTGNATFLPADYVAQTLVVNAVDYRSAASGNWNGTSVWEMRDPGSGSWSATTTPPTSVNNVYIQNGHTITVNIANAFCNDLHLNTAGTLAVSANNTISVSGKIRAYTGTAVTGSSPNDGTFYTGQTSTTTLVASMITTATNALLKFVGGTRNITNVGEWGLNATSNFTMFALDQDAIGTLATGIRFRTITIASGTVSVGNASIYVGSTTGNGNLTINSGAKLRSARVWTGVGGSQAITYNSTSRMGTLQIDNGGILELTGATSAIDCTTFINNGTVIYSGAAQTLVTNSALVNTGIGSAVPSTYNNLIIEGTGIKTLSSSTTVNGQLLVNSGTLRTNANNLTLGGSAVFAAGTMFLVNGGITDLAGRSVTLKSSVSETGDPITASIGTVTGTLNGATNVTVEQYIPSGYRRFRFLSHPFTTAQPLSQLTDNIDITGAGGSANGFTTTATNNASAFYFNTNSADGNPGNDGGWVAFPSAINNLWNRGQGIRVLVRGVKNQPGSLTGGVYTPSEVTLDMTGEINIGNVTVPLSSAGSGTTQGFNLVGNPYPSPVDIGAVLTATPNIAGNSFYVRNPQIGSYTTISPIPASYILPANSAFFVKASAPTSLTFTEAHKNICTNCATVFRNALKTSFQIKVYKQGIEYDNVYINLDDTYKSSYETKYDAIKLMNDELSLYTVASTKHKLAADYRNISLTDTISLGVNLPLAFGVQQYKLRVVDYNMLLGLKLYLYDDFYKTYTLINNETVYDLFVDAANPLSVGENRLKLIASNAIIANYVGVNDNNINVNISNTETGFIVNYKGEELAKTTIQLINTNGQILHKIDCGDSKYGQQFIPSAHLPKGIYLIEVKMNELKVTRKAIK
jgi:hypothetical protein